MLLATRKKNPPLSATAGVIGWRTESNYETETDEGYSYYSNVQEWIFNNQKEDSYNI